MGLIKFTLMDEFSCRTCVHCVRIESHFFVSFWFVGRGEARCFLRLLLADGGGVPWHPIRVLQTWHGVGTYWVGTSRVA